MNTLRVVSFNFERGVHLEEQLEFLTHHPAMDCMDLLLANELDVGCSRSGNRNTAAQIAARLGMEYVFGLEFTELTGEHNETGHHGNAIFSRWPILEAYSVRLPVAYDWFYDAQKRTGGRQAILAQLDVQGKQLGVVCTHLENRTTPEGRCRQLRFLLEEADRAFPGIPVILGGDLNTCGFHGGDKEAMKQLAVDAGFSARHRSAPEEMEPGLVLARQCGFAAVPPLEAAGETVITRRKPVSGGNLFLRVDWLLLRGMDIHSFSVLSTEKKDFSWAAPGCALACYRGTEISDHNAIFATCALP